MGKDEAVPAGSVSVDAARNNMQTQQDPAAPPQEEQQQAQEEQQQPGQPQANDVNQQMSQVTQELQALKQQNQTLAQQLQQTANQRNQANANQQGNKQEQELNELARLIREGAIDLEEGIVRSAQFAMKSGAELGYKKATDKFQKMMQQKESEQIRKSFLKENPDFTELQSSGALNKIKKSNPMHDDFSAYYALKASQAMEQGKQQQAKIQSGVKAASPVLSTPGSSMRAAALNPPPAQKLSEDQIYNEMMSSLSSART